MSRLVIVVVISMVPGCSGSVSDLSGGKNDHAIFTHTDSNGTTNETVIKACPVHTTGRVLSLAELSAIKEVAKAQVDAAINSLISTDAEESVSSNANGDHAASKSNDRQTLYVEVVQQTVSQLQSEIQKRRRFCVVFEGKNVVILKTDGAPK